MARCSRCKKFMLFASESGNCKECEIIILEERHRKEETERKKQEIAKKLEAQKRREEELKKAEEQKIKEEEEQRLKAERERIDKEYRKALSLFSKSITIDQIKTAKQLFISLNGYQDSKEWIAQCNDRLDHIRQEEEHQRKIEEERRLREEAERIRREKQEQEERMRQEEQRRQEEQKRLEEQKRQEEQKRLEEEHRKAEEQKRLEEERIQKEKDRLRIELKDKILSRQKEKELQKNELLLYNEEQEQYALEVESWLKECKEAYEKKVKEASSFETDMQPYSFAGEKITSKVALAYALNANWEEGKKHMARGLILEHFKRDFDAEIISNLMDIDEDASTSDQDVKLFKYICVINSQPDVLLWKNKLYTDVGDYGLQYLKAIKYGSNSDLAFADEIIERDVLKLHLAHAKRNEDELISQVEAFREYIDKVKKNEAADSKIQRSMFAYALAKGNDQAMSLLYSILEHEKRKVASLALVERKEYLTLLADAFSALGDYKEAGQNAKICQERIFKIDQVLNKYRVGSVITYGQFWQNVNNEESEKTDIEWIVLDIEQSMALLISKYVLYSYPYASSSFGYDGPEWTKSLVRELLNDYFYKNAFSMEEQEAIVLSDIDNSGKQHFYSSKYSRFTSNEGKNTKDKLFVLSYAEAWKYFPTEESRKCTETVYAYEQARKYGFGPKQLGYIWWWLRSPGYIHNSAPIVDKDGKFDFDNVNDISGGIRPAFWLNLEPDYSWLE